MQLHAALRDDASFFGSIKRQLSRRGSMKKPSRERSLTVGATTKKPSLHLLDMSERIDWRSQTDPFLDEPATRPGQTMLLLEIPELQSICVNHGERQFRIERLQPITVRDVLIELDRFLHRPAPKLYGNFKTVKVDKDEDKDEDELLEQPHSPKAVVLDVASPTSPETGATMGPLTPDSSESSLSSDAEKKVKPGRSVLQKWLGDKSTFAGLRQAENHDFKLYVRMVKSSGKELSSSPRAV